MADKVLDLVPGEVSDGHFEALLSGTGIEEYMKAALRDHLVNGVRAKDCCETHKNSEGRPISPSQFSKRMKSIIKVHQLGIKLAPYYAFDYMKDFVSKGKESAN